MASSPDRSVQLPPTLGVSIVTFRPELELLERTLRTLCAAVRFGKERLARPVPIWIVDNTPGEDGIADVIDAAVLRGVSGAGDVAVETIRGHGNVGYGRGHNLAIHRSACAYHLVLNPDVELDENAILEAIRFMERDQETGLLGADGRSTTGRPLYLCRGYPAVLDLAVRGFAPRWLARLCRSRAERYELRDLVARGEPGQVTVVSGCCMFFRRSVLDRVGAFAPEYFLYFEDYDLSVRTARVAKVKYVPTVKLVHHGGNAARKGLRHIRFFGVSALRFYRTHGWKLV